MLPLARHERLLDGGDVLLGAAVVPVAAEPLADAAPEIARPVRGVVIVQPADLAVVAGAAYRERVVHVPCGAFPGVGPGVGVRRGDVRALHLQQADAGAAVSLRLRVRAAIAERALAPVGFDDGLGAHGIYGEAPLARGPLDDLVGGAAEVAGDT